MVSYHMVISPSEPGWAPAFNLRYKLAPSLARLEFVLLLDFTLKCNAPLVICYFSSCFWNHNRLVCVSILECINTYSLACLLGYSMFWKLLLTNKKLLLDRYQQLYQLLYLAILHIPLHTKLLNHTYLLTYLTSVNAYPLPTTKAYSF